MLFSEGGNAKEVDLMEEAIDKGIPVIAFNNDDADTPNAHLACIGAHERKVGYEVGKAMQKYLKKSDKIFVPEEVPGMSYVVSRSAGIMDAMKEIGVTWEELDDGYERAETTRRISAYLLRHPETDGIINVGGLTTEVAGMVVEDIKLQNKVVVGGFDLLPNTGPAIKKGINKAVIDQQPHPAS